MHTIILAAGRGTRLGSHSELKPKCLVNINGTTILGRMLDALGSCDIREITIVTGHLEEKITGFLKEQPRFAHVKTVFNPIYATTNNAVSVGCALNQKPGPFLLLDGDLIFDTNLLRKTLQSSKENCLVTDTDKTRLTDEAMKVALNGQNQVSKISKQLSREESIGEYIGMAKIGQTWSAKLQAWISKIDPNTAERAYYEDGLVALLAGPPPLHIIPTDGLTWMEIDTPEDLQEAQKILNNT